MAPPFTLSPTPAVPPAPALQGFRAFELDTSRNPVVGANRLDLYRVSLVTGHVGVRCAGRSQELRGPHLLFISPTEAYTTFLLSARVTGYTCLFTEAFVRGHSGTGQLRHSPLFGPGGPLAFPLAGEQAAHCTELFEKLLAVQHTTYLFKDELAGAYLQLLLHEGLRRQRQEEVAAAPLARDPAPW